MQKAKTILPLLILAGMLLNWLLVSICATHPLGHDHHSHSGPSPCELRAQYKGTAYWPPMDCHSLNMASDEYQMPEEHLVKFTIKTWVVAAMIFQLLNVKLPKLTHATPPDFSSTSDPPIPANTLRGPPFV